MWCPREMDKLMLFQACALSQRRLAKGLRLNYPEASAIISWQCVELAREGYTVAQVMSKGRQMLGTRQVLEGIPDLLRQCQVEAVFPDGTKLITVHDPICKQDGDLDLALLGSFLPIPSLEKFSRLNKPSNVVAGQGKIGGMEFSGAAIAINACPERQAVMINVTNMDDRPIQVGSHFHFGETNSHLRFDRSLGYGKRLHIPAGTAVRFEPGESKSVKLIELGGEKIVQGGNCLGNGKVSAENKEIYMKNVLAQGFGHCEDRNAILGISTDKDFSVTIPREIYASMFGPTTKDKVNLGDTSLVIEIEKDYCCYGDELKFGGGKVLRDGMGQGCGITEKDALDLILLNALVVDYTGIYKADIGIKDGIIVGIGKGGNPATMEGVSENMICGVSTEVIACEGKIITAGGIDTHIHFICPQQAQEAISSGLTTMIGGGTGPTSGANATTCTPGSFHTEFMLKALDDYPLNFGLTGKGNTSDREGMQDMIDAGCIGLKLHEDWGSTPACIDTCLTMAEENDIQVTIHTDTLNEAGNVERTFNAFKGRTVHTYHSEGAGGGHAPDLIQCVGETNVLPSSTNPTRPYTKNTIDEHLDMLMVCHHLDKRIPEDISFAESRIRGETIAAEDILHDLGAISIISSDSQAMGRIGEVITRTWQTANKMKAQFGPLSEDTGKGHDNFRVRRYVAKYTINPAIAHGISHLVGSIEVGKLADISIWNPAFFGVKADQILKKGLVTYSQMGDPNASIPTPHPVYMRPMFGATKSALSSSCVTFVSKSCYENKYYEKLNLSKRVEPIKNCRDLKKADMKLNNYCPDISVDPETYQVSVEGNVITCGFAEMVSGAQRYFF